MRGISLWSALESHKQSIINRIKEIDRLDELTDAFLTELVSDSIVKPLVLHFDQMTRQHRTENIPAERFPFDFDMEPGRSYPKSVVRLSIPYDGEEDLLTFAPRRFECTSSRGRGVIQFDVILFGYPDDADRVKNRVAEE